MRDADTFDLPELVQLCAAGDAQAFRRLYDRLSAKLYAVALRITRQPALASDAVQDAFLQVWRNAGRFNTARGDAEAWLVSLARYRALDLVRRQGREVTGEEMPEIEDEAPDALERLASSQDGRRLRGCLDGLDPDRRRMVVMAFIDGHSHAELAARLAMPLGTVKSTIRRSLASLKRCLES